MFDYCEDGEHHTPQDKESLYIAAIWMLGLMVDNLIWSLMTSGLQDSKECATMMEQMHDMKFFIDTTLAMSEITEDTVFN